MKIAVLTQTYPPMVSGAAIAAGGLAEQMAKRGHQVLVLTASDRPEPYLERRPNLTVMRLRSCRNPVRVNQRFALWPHRQVSAALAEFAPQIIHTHDPLQLAWSGLLHGRQAGIPTVLTIQQMPWFIQYYLPANTALRGLVNMGLWAYGRWLLHRFQGLVTLTRTIADHVQRSTGLDSRVIPYGVDPAVFHPGPLTPAQAAGWRARLDIPAQAPVVLHVGRLDKDKRVERVVQAFAGAQVEMAAPHLLVVGDGTEKDGLVRLAQELKIAGRCHFPGFITLQQGLPEIYRLATAFITASDCETQGLVLLEAAACGLPIAAVAATCIPEIVHPGENGWLATPGDIDDLSRCLRRLLKEPLEAQAMGRAGRQIAMGITLQKTVNDYENFYEDTLRLTGASAPVQEATW